MKPPTFSIILPTHNNGRLIENAITSLLRQTRQDFEVFIVCDGALREGVDSARQWARDDSRFIVQEHPKGPGHGEIYRDQAIRQAKGQFICYLGDDDIWFPNHLTHMAAALSSHDFAYSRRFRAAPGGFFSSQRQNGPSLENRGFRRSSNFDAKKLFVAGFSASGHTLKSYLALPSGWPTRARSGLRSYWGMWRTFMADQRVRVKFIPRITALCLPSNLRACGKRERQIQARDREAKAWLRLIESQFLRDSIDDYVLNTHGPRWTLELLADCGFRRLVLAKSRKKTVKIHATGHLRDAVYVYANKNPSASHAAELDAIIQSLRQEGLTPDNQETGLSSAAHVSLLRAIFPQIEERW
ncbi:MAG: glycosyltransferase family A protein [Cyanobacteria bacterium J06638_7]